jgi:hypothetical protein
VRGLLGGVALLALVVAAGFIPAGDGSAAAATRVGAPLVAGLGLLPVAFAATKGRGFGLALAIVAATCGGVALAARLSRPDAELSTLIAWVLIAFAAIAGIVAPLLVLGWRATAAVVWLCVAALSCGSILVARGMTDSVPQPILDYNPLVRIFWHGLGFDWLHSGNVYPKIGTLYYRYPERSDGILVALVVAAGGAVAGAVIALTRRPRTAGP